MNDRQIELIAQATPKRDYYYQSRLGARLFDLALGPVALAFAAASMPEDQRAIDEVSKAKRTKPSPPLGCATRGFRWAADLAVKFSDRRKNV